MTSVEEISGVGAKAVSGLQKLGINTVVDLIEHYPFRYEFLNETDINNTEHGDKVLITGHVETKPVIYRFKKGINKMNFALNVNGKNISVGVFNRAFLLDNLKPGKELIVRGKYEKDKNNILASEIRFGSLKDYNSIEPVYRTTAGVSRKKLSSFIDIALTKYLDEVIDFLPDYLKESYNLLRKDIALRYIHHPSNENNIKQAVIRLKYEELFMFMLKMNYLKYAKKNHKAGIVKEFNRQNIDQFIQTLPFKLTDDQVTAVDEILKDMSDAKRMNRLVQGDVGSGKTVVSLIAMYANSLANMQSALMAPTEVLARQHFKTFTQLLEGTHIKVELLLRTTKKKDKDLILSRLANGDIDIIVGTHALIQENVTYQNLGLIITDEQHRFGVNQRANFKNKGTMVDVIYMSATPIPRTYALTIYGDMDITSIKSMPLGRGTIKTIVKNNNQITDVLALIQDEINKKNQVFVVAPLIEESEKSDFEDVNSLAEKFEKALGKVAKIGILHGRMKPEEKTAIMEQFTNKEIDILISTTVIEVGVDIPDATMMVVFDAERFGLSTLHQLRGRIGRSHKDAICVLISDKEKERLDIMTKTNDGFEISEADFQMRGQGDIFGVRQSGDMNFKIANIRQDFKILLKAKKDSLQFLKEHVNEPEYKHIKKELLRSVESKK